MKSDLVTIAIFSIAESNKLRQPLTKADEFLQFIDLNDSLQRVCVQEQHVLKVIKLMNTWNKRKTIENASNSNTLLIPIDFSSYSFKTCEVGFRLAQQLDTTITLLYTYCSPSISFTVHSDDEIAEILIQSGKDMDKLTAEIYSKIKQNELPNIQFSYNIQEGLPEEVIIDMAAKIHPSLVIMGTRGKSQKEYDLIGSVTAEVIEHCSVPVLAIPESIFAETTSLKNVLFATNFDDRTLISFTNMMNLIGKLDFKLFFAHFASQKDAWNEIKLSGIKHYFAKNYPNIETDYSIISDKSGDILLGFDKFVKEHKISLIILNTHKRNLFAQLFNPSIARKMVFHAQTPILVFHT